jgi:hypothetical protein
MDRNPQAGAYERPKLERFGTFRELTKSGAISGPDGITVTCEVVAQRS